MDLQHIVVRRRITYVDGEYGYSSPVIKSGGAGKEAQTLHPVTRRRLLVVPADFGVPYFAGIAPSFVRVMKNIPDP